jgi:hypothetical protein
MAKISPLTVHFFARRDSPDDWPGCGHVEAFPDLEESRVAAELSIETTFPTADRFEIVNGAGDILYAWPEEMRFQMPLVA